MRLEAPGARRALPCRRLCALLGLAPASAHAVCPVCTVTVGVGVGLSRWLGIDDVITGLWIGGFSVSIILWTLAALETRQLRWKARAASVALAYFLLLLLPLAGAGLIGHPDSTLWGVDRLVLGITIGALAFWGGAHAYTLSRRLHGDRAWFPFQKVVMPILPLLVLSAAFKYLLE